MKELQLLNGSLNSNESHFIPIYKEDWWGKMKTKRWIPLETVVLNTDEKIA